MSLFSFCGTLQLALSYLFILNYLLKQYWLGVCNLWNFCWQLFSWSAFNLPWINRRGSPTFQSMWHGEFFKFDANFSLICTYYTLLSRNYRQGKKEDSRPKRRRKKANNTSTFEVNTLLQTDFDINKMTNAEMISRPCYALSRVWLRFLVLFPVSISQLL